MSELKLRPPERENIYAANTLAVDIATHALTSLALARGFFPRRRWPIVVGMVVAGTLADVDLVSVLFGPAAYLSGRLTFAHSIIGTVAVIVIATGLAIVWNGKQKAAVADILAATGCAAIAHVLLDICGSAGAALFWPMRGTRYAADWLPGIDAWILALLIAGILLPELFRLVGSEIGAKDKTPRGRNGALVALALVVIYVGARATWHSNAVAILESHSYRGESPRRIGAFADSLSLLTWHGVAETQSNLCLLAVPVGGNGRFDAESAVCMHKPEDSPMLDAAQKTKAAREFLGVARFPRAAVDKTQTGYEVVIRDARDLAEEETRHRVAAQILLDANSGAESEKLVWASEVRLR
jgi:membrane-bound metal-dependent hydrolase YbcI (DUF457 family)